MDEVTFCESCGAEAIARVHSAWLCARCGLDRMTAAAGLGATAGAQRGSTSIWRRATRAAVGSGLAAKVLIGAAALAAVGGVVASEAPPDAHPPVSAPPVSAPPVSTPVGPRTTPVPGDLPDTADDTADDATTPGVIPAERGPATDLDPSDDDSQPSNVDAYLAALQDWTACTDKAVHEFAAARTGGGFDPFAACPARPDPASFGLGNAYSRPDHAGRPDDPGSQRDEAPGRPDDPGSQRNITPGLPH